MHAVIQMAYSMAKFPAPGMQPEAFIEAIRPGLQIASEAGSQAFQLFLRLVLRGEALTWLLEQPRDLTLEGFINAFLERWCATVRFKAHNARQALLERRVTQRRTEDVSSYYARFNSIVRQVQDMSVTEQVFWFINGLKGDLVAACAVQPNGQPWHNLQDLVEFALGAEARLKAVRAVTDRMPHARPFSRAQSSPPVLRGRDEEGWQPAHHKGAQRSYSQAAGCFPGSGPGSTSKGGSPPKQGGGPPAKRPSPQPGQPQQQPQSKKPKQGSPIPGSIKAAAMTAPQAPNAAVPTRTNAEVAFLIADNKCAVCAGNSGQHAPGCPRRAQGGAGSSQQQ